MSRESVPKKVVAFIVEILNDSDLVELKAQKRPAKISVKEYELLAAQGRVMVHYAGSKYDKAEGLGLDTQERNMFFDCIVLRKSLRQDSGEDEALDILEAVGEVLTGKRHTDCLTALSMESDSFLSSDDDKGVLQYQARVTCRALMVPPTLTIEEAAVVDGDPLLQKVTPYNND